MAFFPGNYHNSEAGFTPLFRLLSDFDNYARQSDGQNGRSSRTTAPAFQPKFDVRELDGHFDLHGELPGLSKKDVDIEFTDPHTLRIHGRIERTYTSSPHPATLISGTQDTTTEQDKNETEKHHRPTVEDYEDGVGAKENANAALQRSRAVEKKEAKVDKAKYWCNERTVGEFSRTFNFPGQIQQDAVTASLDNGILNIKVPKAPKHEARRIAID